MEEKNMLHMRIPATLIGLTLPFSGILLPERIAAQSFAFYTIDVPCGACTGGIALSTSAQGINAAGDVVGSYTDTTGVHGFLLRNGQFTSIDVPGSLMGVAGTLPTTASGIGPSGEIVGSYTAPLSAAPFSSPEHCLSAPKSASCVKGFLYSEGNFSTVLFPLTSPSAGYHPGAVPHEITADGKIYGCLHDYDLGSSMFGAAWARRGDFSLTAGGGELASSDPFSAAGVPMSMNNGATPDGHTIVGHWTDMMTPSHTHGFIVQNGEFHVYDVPASRATVIWRINAGRAFVGFYASDKSHSFLQQPDESAPITLDLLPGFPANIASQANGINAGGVIVGQYTDSNKHLHGFLAVPLEKN